MLLNTLVVFQPNAPLHLCRSYDIANTYVGTVTMLCAECIFAVRAYAVWERGRWFAAVEMVAVIAYLVPITVSLQQFNSSFSEPCYNPDVTGYLDDMEMSSKIHIAFGLLAVAELQTLLLLLYRVVKGRGGWGIDNRLMRGLMKDNMLYCGCGFAFSLSIILTTIFLPFPVAHLLAEFVHSHFGGGDGRLFGTGLRLSFKPSWLRECTGASGDRIVLLASLPQMPLSQRG
ncbi:hypothetical protein EDB19DRAFT_1904369 [Suillus lakei]|nr:hypothetical protein EDB19DRAFT_1904369 [Suillus lakei]